MSDGCGAFRRDLVQTRRDPAASLHRTVDEPVPIGFGLDLDPSVTELEPGVWFGGSPGRVLRLTEPGRVAWRALRAGPVTTRAAGRLARRLTDANMAQPRPPAVPVGDVTVLVPVFDRPHELARCLAAVGRTHPVVVVDDGSCDAAAIATVARHHGATLVRRDINGGPAAARNAGLAAVTTEFVAFLDSDCEPRGDWIAPLVAHLADPLVAAVAPRIAAVAPRTWAGRYTTARGSLDLGASAARVTPTSRVSYVPTAALVARHTALLDVRRSGYVFDPAMRVGEDVDLVWRLHEAGWRVRYEPDVQVSHREPATWRGLLRRRSSYGTSAAALARAHPAAALPLVVHPWPALAVAGLLARRPLAGGAAFAMSVASMTWRLRRSDVPAHGVVPAMASAARQTWVGVGRYATQFGWPLLLGAAVPGNRGRRLAIASLLLGPPLTEWSGRRPTLDPVRFTVAHLADEIAYGTGVWLGCVRARTTAPLRPAVAWRPLAPQAQRVSAPLHTEKETAHG